MKRVLLCLIGLLSACDIAPEPVKPPELDTVNSSEITMSGVTLKSSIKTVGSHDITEYGFIYSEKSADDEGIKTKHGGIDPKRPSPIPFEDKISSLKLNTQYFVRSYASTSEGTFFSEETSFKTLNIVQPGIRTDGVENLTPLSARLKGTITSKGTYAITQYGIVWGKDPSPTTALSTKQAFNTAVNTFPTSIVAEAGTLSPNTKYYFRAFVVANNVTTYGAELNFTTGSIIQPGIRTDAASAITINSARLTGTVLSKGTYPISEYGIVWSNATLPQTKVSQSGDIQNIPNTFTLSATGLQPNTSYNYKAYVISNGVTTYGEEKSFRTSSIVQPGISTGGADGITSNSARLNGSLTSGGSYPISEFGVCWGTNANPTTSGNKASESGNVTTFPRSFGHSATGLNANTAYYYRAYVISNGVTTYGEQKSFKTTSIIQPSVNTGGADAITANSARLSGTLTAGGSNPISEYGIVWGTSSNPTTSGSKASESGNVSSFPKNFTYSASGLNPNTTYFFRAYVISNGVITYGNEMSFKTSNVSQPSISTGENGAITFSSARLSGTLNSGGTYAISEFGVCWSTNSSPNVSGAKAAEYTNVTTFPRNFTFSATGLNAGTVYYYRAYVISNGVVTYGAVNSFRTADASPPVISTGTATRGAAITFYGQVQSGGSYGISEYGIVVSTSNREPTTSDTRLRISGSPSSFPHTYSQSISNPVQNAVYYYRAYVISNGVTYYGNADFISNGKD
jgi:hypothetical protein